MRIRSHLFRPAGRNGHITSDRVRPFAFSPHTAEVYLDALANQLRWWHWKTITACFGAWVTAAGLTLRYLPDLALPQRAAVLAVAAIGIEHVRYHLARSHRASMSRNAYWALRDDDRCSERSFQIAVLNDYERCGVDVLDNPRYSHVTFVGGDTIRWLAGQRIFSVATGLPDARKLSDMILELIEERHGTDVRTVVETLRPDWDGTLGDLITVASEIADENTTRAVTAAT